MAHDGLHNPNRRSSLLSLPAPTASPTLLTRALPGLDTQVRTQGPHGFATGQPVTIINSRGWLVTTRGRNITFNSVQVISAYPCAYHSLSCISSPKISCIMEPHTTTEIQVPVTNPNKPCLPMPCPPTPRATLWRC